ncbi:glycosyltransferase family 2 protein [Acinetobacter pseudolwoffii]|uniref:glycosyltransferase family 2 protein n=1 Tax=Acinetobacter pseudolwoffii TaxID=2053287 RepID=UPI0025772BC1|nr:glycosyltransferase family 2 protein [Acinetobacter pseudolwoffii]MDM1324943.1 glycosyltransferase family 2 protein [Acinetobacter pseudolwoffii]
MSRVNRLSILMPVYNEEKYISEAVASIFSYESRSLEIELIVVDDMSTDSTYEILLKLSQSISQIKLYKNNFKGKNNALNMAYLNSTGQYICLMGGDDLIEPKVLELRVNAILNEKIKGEDLIYSCCKIKTFSSIEKYNNILIPKAKGKGSSSGGAITLTRSLCDKIFPIPSNLPNEDSWIAHYLEYFLVKRVEAPEIGLHYRIHSHNSHKRGLSFDKHKDQMWTRSRSALLFYNKYYLDLSVEQEIKLVQKINIATAIYLQQHLAIIFSSNLSLRQKIIALTQSSKIFYYIKNFLYKYLVGR